MSAPTPPVIPKAFAIDAAPTEITFPIPTNATGDPGAVSWDLGFPPATMKPIATGGIGPYGQDMNGAMYTISSHTVYVQSGQSYRYNLDVVTAIGGYGVGTLLGRADSTGLWLNVLANNVNDPDAGGAGWVPAYNYGKALITGLTNVNRTLTALEYARPLVILSGTLTGNVQVIFPNTLQQWLVVNATTGAFTVTAKTAAGTGVIIQQSGFAAPTGIYGDGTNIYPNAPPAQYPVDAAATPNTLVLRTSAGYALATYFNQSSANEPGVTAANVFVDIGDGFLRKLPMINFQGQINIGNTSGSLPAARVPLLQNMNGAVTASQVPLLQSLLGAVTAAQVPNLSGLNGQVSNAQVPIGAVTQYFGANLTATKGHFTLPTPSGSVIVNWGYDQGAGGPGDMVVTFDLPFPTQFLFGGCHTNRNTGGVNGYNNIFNPSLSDMTAVFDAQNNGFRGGWWFAVGN